MSLVINHNMMAMNATRNLNDSYGKLATSTRRLSSGLRVGTAADDAAGLAMRELMRADIKTLGQGLRNANDGISMIQTADGALGVIDAKLIRMKELAEQASTGTYTDVQRKMINQEYQLMAKEITRIAQDTDFNSRKLLAGTGLPIQTQESKVSPTDTSTAISLGDVVGNEETWEAAKGVTPVNEVSVAATNMTFSESGDIASYGNNAGAAGSITFSQTNKSGLKITNAVAAPTNATADTNAINYNKVTGEITTKAGAPTVASSVPAFVYGSAANNVTSYKVESLTPPATTWNDVTPAAGATANVTAGQSFRITATLADGSTFRDTVTNNTAGVFTVVHDNTNKTLTLTSTTDSTSQLNVKSEVIGEKSFEFTTKTGTQVTNKVTTGYDDPTTLANENVTSASFTHNTKTGAIELKKEATIESVINATFGDVNNIPKSIKIETFDASTGTWTEQPFVDNGNFKEVTIDPSVKSFRVTTDYGDGKQTRDTVSNNTDGAFTLKELTSGTPPTANGVGYELVQTTGGAASSTQLDVKSDDLVVVNVHFGSGNTDADNYDTSINQVTARALGVGDDAQDSVDTQDNAKRALENLTEAIRRKDEVRAEIGSTQNRLAATIENVSIQKENLQASESRISDVDVATEMTEFNKTQIMTNAAVSMLAQANSLPKMAQKLLDAR